MSDQDGATPVGTGGAGGEWRQGGQQRAYDLGATVHRVRAELPQETTVWDAERLAAVSLDRNGTPTRVLVGAGWDTRCTPEALARAVVDAGRAAALALDEQARAALADQAAARRARWAEARPSATPPPQPVAHASDPRPLDELAEIAITSLAAVSHQTASDAGATLGLGRALDGEVEVRVGRGGIVDVGLGGHRVAKASAGALSALLTDAVQDAVQDLARRVDQEAPAVPDELLAEVLTHLRSMTADPLSPSGVGRVAASRERS